MTAATTPNTARMVAHEYQQQHGRWSSVRSMRPDGTSFLRGL